MKKLFVLVVLTFLSTEAFTQVKVKVAAEAGFNAAMQVRKIDEPNTDAVDIESSELAPGASAAVMVDIKILRNFYIQSGPAYFFNNIKYVTDVDLTSAGLEVVKRTQYDRLHTFRLPVYAMYKSGYEGMGRFIAGIGPYMSYAFMGNRVLNAPLAVYDPSTNKTTYSMSKTNTELKLGNEAHKDDYKQWEYGVNACIGYEANIGIYFRGSINYGFPNMDPANNDNYKIKNWGFGLSIGYLIGKDSW